MVEMDNSNIEFGKREAQVGGFKAVGLIQGEPVLRLME